MPTLKTDTETFFRVVYPYPDKIEAQVKAEYLSGYHFKTYWPSTAVEVFPSKNVITSAVSLPLGESQNVKATLVMMIDEDKIFRMLKQIQWSNSSSANKPSRLSP